VVRLVRETGKPIAQVARDLGICSSTLKNWVVRDRWQREDGDGRLRAGRDVLECARLGAVAGAYACTAPGSTALIAPEALLAADQAWSSGS
jgi:transposase-like protein